MGLSISLAMSIVGPALSGHPSFPAFIVSFLCSSVISIIIAIIVPIKKITDSACEKIHLNPEGVGGRFFSALVSDLIFTPIMTFLMVFMNYKRAKMFDPGLSFVSMFLGNVFISFTIAYLIILVFLPLFIKGSIAIVKNFDESEEK